MEQSLSSRKGLFTMEMIPTPVNSSDLTYSLATGDMQSSLL